MIVGDMRPDDAVWVGSHLYAMTPDGRIVGMTTGAPTVQEQESCVLDSSTYRAHRYELELEKYRELECELDTFLSCHKPEFICTVESNEDGHRIVIRREDSAL